MPAPSAQPSLGLTLLLGLLVALSALGMDMFLPSVPVIARDFGAAPGAAQSGVTNYLLGLAAGQLAWGPLSDRFGRKPVLLCGLGLFLAASLAGAFAGSVQEVALLRLAQGFGMSSGPVVARSVVRDLYARDQAAQLLGRMMVVFGFIPLCAPLIGAQAIGIAGWPAVFWLLAAIALALLLAAAFGLAETSPAEKSSIAPHRVAAGFALLAGDARFRAALAPMLCAQMGIIAFVTGAPFAVAQALQLTPVQFSYVFAGVMIGQISGSLLGSRLVARHGIFRMVKLGAFLTFAAGLALAALAVAGVAHWLALVLPMIVFLFGGVLVIPNATAAALAPFPERAGAASSLLGALPFGLGALVSAGLGSAFDGTMRPMALAIALFGLLCFLAEKFRFRKMSHG